MRRLPEWLGLRVAGAFPLFTMWLADAEWSPITEWSPIILPPRFYDENFL